ncbi:hypothetical protein BDV93DRAFT_225346 [Ceratobasidium sp. AG-I]|nr:hypothetical protein BDV93DRAFT_225346 [Ceratobasidium sp. AG-I]
MGLSTVNITAAEFAGWYLYSIVYTSVTLLVTAALWAQLIRARISGTLNGTQIWMVNAEDLASNTHPLCQRATWGGVSREKHLSPRRHVRIAARLFGMFVNFIRNSVVRRVVPVETLLYAFFQNIVALAAIVLILTRVIILLTQLQNEDFQTRTGVQECSSFGLTWNNISLLVGHPEDRNINTTTLALNTGEYSSQIRIALGDFKTPFTPSNSSDTCGTGSVHSRVDSFNVTDRYLLYNCTCKTTLGRT